jgi:hypothetical protein
MRFFKRSHEYEEAVKDIAKCEETLEDISKRSSKGRAENWWRDFGWEEYGATELKNSLAYPAMAKNIVVTNSTYLGLFKVPDPSQKLVPLVCEKCGAPMKNPYKCEYCWTVYGPKQSLVPVQPSSSTEIPAVWKELLGATKKFTEMGLVGSS